MSWRLKVRLRLMCGSTLLALFMEDVGVPGVPATIRVHILLRRFPIELVALGIDQTVLPGAIHSVQKDDTRVTMSWGLLRGGTVVAI